MLVCYLRILTKLEINNTSGKYMPKIHTKVRFQKQYGDQLQNLLGSNADANNFRPRQDIDIKQDVIKR